MKGLPSPIFISGGDGPFVPECPSCHTPSEAWTRLGDRPGGGPKPGNVSVCIFCSSISIYSLGARGLTLRLPTEAERAEIEGDGLLEIVRAYTHEVRQRRQQ